MKNLLTIAILFLYGGCSFTERLANDRNREFGSVVEEISKNAGRHSIAYRGYNLLVAEVNKECDLTFCDSVIRKINVDGVPKGGYITVFFSGYTLQESNPENYDYVVQDTSGKILRRANGDKYSIPSHSSSGGWTDVDVFDIRLPVTYPFKVFIINKLDNTRSEFIVKSGN